jgi:hypothetical protein
VHREARRCSAGEAGVIRTQGTTWRSRARFAVTEAANTSRSTDIGVQRRGLCKQQEPGGLVLAFLRGPLSLVRYYKSNSNRHAIPSFESILDFFGIK